MNIAAKAVLMHLLSKKYIGGSHTPEKKLIVSKTKWLNSNEKKKFDKEYKEMLNKEMITRQKKKTGKGSDYHISLNPRKLPEISEMLEL